jgi:hypothetical protein
VRITKELKKKSPRTIGQLVVVKERKKGRMATGRRRQQKQVGRKVRGEKKKVGYRKKPLRRKRASFYFLPR